MDNGIFEKHGLVIEPVKFESSNQIIDALLSGKIDGTAPVALEALLTVEERYPGQFKIFEMTVAQNDTTVHRILVRTDSKIKNLTDLEGKIIIGTMPGSQMKVLTELVLRRHTNTSDLNIVSIPPSLQIQALTSSQVDAIFALEPTGTIAESKGVARVIAMNPLYELLKPFPTAASVFSTDSISRNPAVIREYIEAIEESHQLIESSELEAKSSLSNYTNIDRSLAAHVGIYRYWGMEDIDRSVIDRLVGLYLGSGIMENVVSPNDILLRFDEYGKAS
jgi:NitT/TauT family transport system substrate-binding protein